MSHDEIISNMREINIYFSGCLDHTRFGSSTQARFIRYIETVAEAIVALQEDEKLEDDGK